MLLKGKTIAVTGASGMIGVYLCRSLLSEGATVIGVVRNPEKAAFLAAEGVEFRKADLMDRAALEKAFLGCDAVISNAAMYIATKAMGALKAHQDANIEGTRNVLEAAHSAGVKRITQISTFGIYKWSLFKTITEDSPQLNGAKGEGGPYRATKQSSEQLAWELAKKYNLQLTTFRPAGVFGARDFNTLQTIYKFMRIPFMVMPSISFPLIYAGDLANTVTKALSTEKSINQAYNVTGTPKQISEFFKAIIAVLNKKPKYLFLPLPIAIKVDNSKAERDLGFKTRSHLEAMKEIVAEEKPPKYLGGL